MLTAGQEGAEVGCNLPMSERLSLFQQLCGADDKLVRKAMGFGYPYTTGFRPYSGYNFVKRRNITCQR